MKWLTALFYLAILLSSLPSHAADINVKVDRNPITMNESFQLTLEAQGSVDADPDFSSLKQDFDILNQRKSSNISIINGNYNKLNTWTLSLIPKRTGKLMIPSIRFGSDASPAYAITVKKTTTTNQNNDKLFIEAQLSSKEAYVQSQIIYTIKLYSAYNLARLGFSDLEIINVDTIVEPLGEQKQYQTTRNGQPYLVIEQRYALFPQQAGSLQITPTQAEVEVVTRSSNSFFNRFGGNTVTRRIGSEAHQVMVKAIPANVSNRTWLPTSNLHLNEQWPDDISEYKVGEPITRTVTLTADGLTSAQLPELMNKAISGLKQYPDQAKLEDSRTSEGLRGRRQEKVAYIPTQAGRYTLPAIELPWWNTKTAKIELARIPARTIQVMADTSQTDTTASADKTELPGLTENITAPNSASNNKPAVIPTEMLSQTRIQSNIWFWLSLVLAGGWLMTLAAWWQKTRSTKTDSSEQVQTASLRQTKKAIQIACQANDPIAAKDALLNWARLQYPENAITSLGSLQQQLPTNAQQELTILNQQLYHPHFDKRWNGNELWQTIKNLPATTNKNNPDSAGLEPLYK